MKKYFLIYIVVIFAAAGLFAQDWSGVMDSTVSYSKGAGSVANHSFGIEQFVNLRLRVRTREMATFNASFNLIAATGHNALTLAASNPMLVGENYAATMEIERLFVRIVGEEIDTELGLLRMNFGYGQVWGSTDFLNPRNPMAINARPRGVLGINSSYYPTDTLRIMGFISAPSDPLQYSGGGYTPGILLEQHWDTASLQAFYAYETPIYGITGSTARDLGIHSLGASLKFDLELGFVIDALYRYNPRNSGILSGLSLGAGFDYSFMGGDLIVIAEYLYNGSQSITAKDYGGNWQNRNYLYASALYRIDDFRSLSLAAMMSIDDHSFMPMATFNYDVFQGFSVNIAVQVPLDRKSFGGTRAGELGPETTHSRFSVNVGARLRF